jgi:peptidoglycan-associated lipoprotein
MKYNIVGRWALVSVLGVVLAGCQSKQALEGSAVTSEAAATEAAGYRLPGQIGYTASLSDFHQNALTAPANQTYYFEFDRSQMRSEDLKALAVQTRYLVAHPEVKIRLAGHTDDRGSREYNVALGWRRVQSVARLLEQAGVRPGQIQMLSYGKERPVTTAHNAHAWALNRRVNLVYKD